MKQYVKIFAFYLEHAQQTFSGEDCCDTLLEGLTVICRQRKLKGFPIHIIVEIDLKPEFTEILIRKNVFKFCIKRGIRFTLRTIANQQEVVGNVEYYCLGDWRTLDRKEISMVLQMPHTNFERWRDDELFPRYWRFTKNKECVENVNQFIETAIVGWTQKAKELNSLAKNRREFSTEIFINLLGKDVIDFTFNQSMLFLLFKIRACLCIFIYDKDTSA